MTADPAAAPRRSLLLGAYLAVSRVAGPLARWILSRRLARGKEDPARFSERLGRDWRDPRPDGPLLHIHAASVGEAVSALGLIGALAEARPALSFLVTTGTRTSAAEIARRAPPRTRHAYAPLDAWAPVTRFLDHWRPDAHFWVESEIWPAFICAAHARGAPLALIGARMSERSARGWARAPGAIGALLGRFRLILAQEEATAARLRALGAAGVDVTGSLKASAPPPDADPAALARMRGAIGERPVLLALSTHAGEEAAVLEAAARLRGARPDLLTLIAPRHPERGAEIAALAGAGAALRSAGAAPEPGVAVYIADTLGEMGLWSRLAPFAFLGGSMAEMGGHNPYEIAGLGVALIHGAHLANFTAPYAALREADASLTVADGAALAAAAAALFDDPARAAAMGARGRAALAPDPAPLRAAMAALAPLLDGL